MLKSRFSNKVFIGIFLKLIFILFEIHNFFLSFYYNTTIYYTVKRCYKKYIKNNNIYIFLKLKSENFYYFFYFTKCVSGNFKPKSGQWHPQTRNGRRKKSKKC